ncbi:hypothetical protein C0V70_03440 [Bacteriovorax stolpii]|uniref:Uncharacterized protein n=1 Tax=Bacteriovorax stolpii TaxID=960 RepID=A0A2K9NNW0_BACTC|nr:hypothetical protein [Bacteriovorax stolpii]AUN97177.1 hypothetical protein C0V70_03440 [Bacteriovorax stolpii]TDP53463.1 hypothetical protein C8D79_2107 [Bacteriovorax stolpii]
MKVLISFLFLCLLSFHTYAVEATHGMVLFGQEKLMAYHLPMYHKIHNKQVVLEYSLSAELKTKLLSHMTEGQFLTFVPAPFDLEAFLLKPHALVGDVYAGHFEKEGVVVMENVTLDNVKVLYQRTLIKPNAQANHYLLFGTPSDLYEVHLLNGGLQVDHILKASVNASDLATVNLTNYAMNTYSPVISEELLNDKEESSIELFYEVPCRRRHCDTVTKKLKVTAEKTYFKDDVM